MPAISTVPAAPLRMTLATPPDIEARPSNEPLSEHGPHLIPDDHTNTMFFILVTALLAGHKPTYLHIICAHSPKKTVPHHVQWAIGGDRIQYDGNVSTKTTT